jgi:hypothetical protein
MKKDVDTIIERALTNVQSDRGEAIYLLTELKMYLAGAKERYADSGAIAAKYVETLQRSNEQLVKLATLLQRREIKEGNVTLDEDDKQELLDIINEK